MKKIRIFDTTLRDGEQSPGFAMVKEDKVLFAKQLEALGVDVIEAGFPLASPQDFEAVEAISKVCNEVEVCALARCNEKDIAFAIEALKCAKKPRIHVFIATSEIHLKFKLKMTQQEVIEKAVKGVKQARNFTSRVEFSAEDATRTDRKFLIQVLEAVIAAGVDVLNIPDTVGYMTPDEYGDLIDYLMKNVSGIDKVIISAHCHDDFGLAVANSLAAVKKGALQVECTINGIGERAGNAPLEEVVMTLKTRQDIYNVVTGVDSVKLLQTSQILGEITGHKVVPNKAIVGKNAFAHGSGIHQHGILAHHHTYAIMNPADVGFQQTQIILSKHSGKHALKHRITQLGLDLDELELDKIFIKFKELADKKKCIYDEDLLILLLDAHNKSNYELLDIKVSYRHSKEAFAEVSLRVGDEIITQTAEASGPVNAIYKAMQSMTNIEGILQDFMITSFTPGEAALGVVTILWTEVNDKTWQGTGRDVDILFAAGLAFIDMLNRRYVIEKNSSKPFDR